MRKRRLLSLLCLVPALAGAAERLVVKGSDTLGAKMVPMLAKSYQAQGHDVTFEIAAEGSFRGFSEGLAGAADFRMASRAAKESEKAEFEAGGKELVARVAAIDMIAVVVHESNPTRSLTSKQLEGIFTGEITDWAELGGKSGKISVFTRNTSSGTYKTFRNLAMGGKAYDSHCQKTSGSDPIWGGVANNPLAIGYVGLAYVGKKGLRALSIDGIAPEPKNAATYALSRNLYYYTVGEPEGETKSFLDWATSSAEAAKVIETVGFLLPVPQPEPAAP